MADEYLHPPSMRHRTTSEAANGSYGEIIEVQGGHIVRSTGKKDRHSKVCTAKGTRDRRVRLSAHTAIQFYDVQDRLGFDRPSKAVDWLIKKAKTSIDELDELPPWNPVDAIRNAAANAKPRKTSKNQILLSPPPPPHQQNLQFVKFDGGGEQMSTNDNESRFLPPSIESDSISDTMKSFFPVVGSSTETPPPDLLSRTNSQNQDLRLSLHHHHHASASASLLYGQSNPLGFDTSPASWEHQSSEFGRIQRLVALNSGGVTDTGNGGGFLFSPPPPATSLQPLLGQSQLYSQRSTLQSSYTPMIRAWFDPHHHQSISTNELNHNQVEFSSGFRVPARFQGQEEEQHDKPYSASSISRH